MRKLIILALFLLGTSLLLAQTDVSGDVSGTWSTAGSPYNVTGDITLQQGAMLTIEPGVQVIFQGHYSFNVYGRLLAIGNDANHITFTASDTNTGWGGIRFTNINTNGQDTTKVFYCDFEYGIANGNNSSGGAIYLKNSDVYFMHVNVSNNQAMGYGGAIYIEESSPIFNYVEVFNNTAVFDGGGIYCGFNSHPVFYKVAIAHNSTQWNGGGIAFFNNSDASLVNLTIADNHADQNGQAISVVYQTTINILSSILWNNGYPEIYWNSSSMVLARYSDIENGENFSYFGDGCIDTDPLFVNPSSNDYTLNGHSPCINTGSPDHQYLDPDGTRADMGAYYFAVAGIMGNIIINFAQNDDITTYEDVTVIISGDAEGTTHPNDEGVYFYQLDPGDYYVTAELPGYYITPADPIYVHVDAGVLTIVEDMAFSPPIPGTVWGWVYVTGNGDPGQISIDIDGVTGNPFPIYIADQLDHWEYSIEVTSGHHTLTANLPGYQLYTVDEFIVAPSEMTRIDIYMQPQTYPGRVSGTIILKGADGTGTGPGNIEDVIITDGIHTAHPDATGHYVLDTYAGTQNITASLSHYNSVTRKAVVLLDETTTGVDFVLFNWDPVPGNQYVMTLFATITYDGYFIKGEGTNSMAIFGPGGFTDCRGTGLWIQGNPPGWDTALMHYDLPGYWYITPTSDVLGDPNDFTNCEQLNIVYYDDQLDQINTCYQSIPFIDGYNLLGHLKAPSPLVTQSFNLIPDWNWISFNVVPPSNSVSSIFASLTPNDIKEVKWEYKDEQYWDPTWIGDLPNIEMNYGLKVFMLNGANFSIDGEKINSVTNPIITHVDTLNQYNYNWVAYYPEDPLPIGLAVESLQQRVTTIKGQNKSAVQVESGIWIGDLTILEPGKSYLMNINTDGTYLVYPPKYYYENLISKDLAQEPVNNPANWKLISGNNTNMILMANIQADPSRYAVGIFDDENNCRSIGKFVENIWYFTVLGDDASLLTVKIYDTTTGKTIDTDYSFEYQANEMLGSYKEPINIKFETQAPANEELTMLKGNYPNPFNPTTYIKFAIPNEGKVILSIYNLKGQLVETLINGNMTKGEHTVKWDASKHGSGIYFYKLRYDNKTEIRKCIMLK